ncbi:fumarate hydratase subunit beta [Breznakia sp. PF5-3]|uniref:FumA C-terminus/TtdB family hydratase beta subunit n=1 Tax=unclassified Breznakia TaxID=2623764 RepID=UPI0024049A6B|nr:MULTISPECIES: FumA C-terminus/TtdB family hydratase beta subunit [unclassified Breznakia]MDF9824276.1 fumarate hydratase subunit beta [Breznakia sp. PM6-1]MDF9835500.1 fumarate hydratase subunit beta [Breznakia sp. PF5-3]MDF9838026.1 fumarate hydratase subunit beta [Breznakia sp. PFB2-8]MDF9859404.1 fumarate hydratase subunit beta [Breznakia sp. PH5-24]
MIKVTTPITKKLCETLQVGDLVYITGTIYTARDAAHKRLTEMINQGIELPFDLKDATIYYVGPTPTPPNKTFGSAGPTTSARMDTYAGKLYDLGVSVTIGKGYRSKAVQDAIIKNNALYMVAIGGAGALLGKCVKHAEVIAFEDLGTEAIQRLEVVDFPVTVAIDGKGRMLYE